MKKICYVVNVGWYFASHWLERAVAAQKADYEIFVVSNFSDQASIAVLRNLGFKCYHIELSAQSINPFNVLTSCIKTWVLLRKINPDLLHCITIKPNLIGGFFACSHNKLIILSFVGLGRVFTLKTLTMTLIRYLALRSYHFISRHSNCLLAFEHKYDQAKLMQLSGVGQDKTVVINGCGVDPAVYPYVLETVTDSPVVLFASRLLWSKGLGDLVEAKRRLLAKSINFKLNVAGLSVTDDRDAISLQQIEQWQRAGLINWLGYHANVYTLIKNANIIALPTTYSEGIPRILLEACSVGRACIAYDVDGCRSLIIDDYNGSLVKKHDLTALTEKLALLLTNPAKRIKMGLGGRQLVEDKFSSSLVINNTLKLYDGAFTGINKSDKKNINYAIGEFFDK